MRWIYEFEGVLEVLVTRRSSPDHESLLAAFVSVGAFSMSAYSLSSSRKI